MKACPTAEVQAQVLLEWLHCRYPGQMARASYVEHECYPELLTERNWRGRPWRSRRGVGKFLRGLIGGPELVYWPGENKRTRVYVIPRAITVHAAKRA